ncbi:MAG: hypothetical protein DRP45_08315 [Candidatus Zixiibacteriota bacterium]|nr:MAG: hypothetical protein DRP45_08315 [candidate division Zixibacteria bacterium]
MNRYSIILIIFLAVLVGCAPYPRYRKHAGDTPREIASAPDELSTTESVRFGLILQKHLGKPYKGKSKWEEGIDCSKFTCDVFMEFDRIRLPRKAAEQFKIGSKVSFRRLRYGDLVFFKTERGKISHVGIYTGYNEFIHASTSRGVIVSNLSEKSSSTRYSGGTRVLDVSLE